MQNIIQRAIGITVAQVVNLRFLALVQLCPQVGNLRYALRQSKSSVQSATFGKRNPKDIRKTLNASADTRELFLCLSIVDLQITYIAQQIVELIVRHSGSEIL